MNLWQLLSETGFGTCLILIMGIIAIGVACWEGGHRD